MSLALTTKGLRHLKHDRRSVLAVTVLTFLALLLGAILKSSVENRSQRIERKGVTASVPANWVVEDGAGDLIFASWDPFVPDVRYTVYLTPNQGKHLLTDVSLERNLALGKALEGFKVLEETPIIRRGREGYKVTYAFIDTNQPGMPIVLQGVDYYFPADNSTLVVSLQAHDRDYDEALLRFEAFLDSVSYK
jgi:hypothetical protein